MYSLNTHVFGDILMSITWTIRADKRLDRLVNENVRLLGYSSKAELIREAVREFVLRKNAGRMGLYTLDKYRKEAESIDSKEALERLGKLTSENELVEKILKEERNLLEKALLSVNEDEDG